MNKPLTTQELAMLQADTPQPMTKREKLLRLAEVIERGTNPVAIFDKIEYLTMPQKQKLWSQWSAFELAGADPVFRAQGLAPTPELSGHVSVGDGQKFFGLTNEELHLFS